MFLVSSLRSLPHQTGKAWTATGVPIHFSKPSTQAANFVDSAERNETRVLKSRILCSLPPHLRKCRWDLRNILTLFSLHHEILWLHSGFRERGRRCERLSRGKWRVQTTSGEWERQLTYKSSVISKNQFKCKLPMVWLGKGFLLQRKAGEIYWGHFTIGQEGCFIHLGLKSKLVAKSHTQYWQHSVVSHGADLEVGLPKGSSLQPLASAVYLGPSRCQVPRQEQRTNPVQELFLGLVLKVILATMLRFL